MIDSRVHLHPGHLHDPFFLNIQVNVQNYHSVLLSMVSVLLGLANDFEIAFSYFLFSFACSSDGSDEEDPLLDKKLLCKSISWSKSASSPSGERFLSSELRKDIFWLHRNCAGFRALDVTNLVKKPYLYFTYICRITWHHNFQN